MRKAGGFMKHKSVLVVFMLLAALQVVSAATLLYEDFEGVSFPPALWTKDSTGTCRTWVRRTSGQVFRTGGSAGVVIANYSNWGSLTGTSYLRTPTLNFSSANPEWLSFYFRCPGLEDTFGLCSKNDTMKIQASTNGTNWTTVLAIDSNYIRSMPNQMSVRDTGVKVLVNLSAFNGQTSVSIRWMFVDNTPGFVGTNRYFNIDSVYVYDAVGAVEEESNMLSEARILEIRPNPFRAGNVILSESKNLQDIKIFDMTGNLVQALNANKSNNVIRWDGKDKYGILVKSGIYFVVLETNDNQRKTGKILFSR
jgi:hypothetical protein